MAVVVVDAADPPGVEAVARAVAEAVVPNVGSGATVTCTGMISRAASSAAAAEGAVVAGAAEAPVRRELSKCHPPACCRWHCLTLMSERR